MPNDDVYNIREVGSDCGFHCIKCGLIINDAESFEITTEDGAKSHYHKTCFCNKISDLIEDNNRLQDTLKEHDIQDSFGGELNVLEAKANDYGKTIIPFIKDAVDYYIKNNPIPISFMSEMDFQHYIELNLSKLNKSYIHHSSQYNINCGGEIDILAVDNRNNLIIIEVKLEATHYALSQVLSYQNMLEESDTDLCKNAKSIHGIIIGLKLHNNLLRAVKSYNKKIRTGIPYIRLFEFNTTTREFIEIPSISGLHSYVPRQH